jgi:Helix-turn-helix domain
MLRAGVCLSILEAYPILGNISEEERLSTTLSNITREAILRTLPRRFLLPLGDPEITPAKPPDSAAVNRRAIRPPSSTTNSHEESHVTDLQRRDVSSAPLTPAAAAVYLGISEKTLTKWRQAGKGPAFVRNQDGRVRYTIEALKEWRATQTVTIRYSPLELAVAA